MFMYGKTSAVCAELLIPLGKAVRRHFCVGILSLWLFLVAML